MRSLHKNIQSLLEFLDNGALLDLQLLLIYINEPPYDCICNIAIYDDDTTTLFSKCDQASDLCLQLELASEFQSGQQDIGDQGRKWLADFNAGKTQLVLFDQSNNTSAIDVKMHEFVLDEKSSFKMLGLFFSFQLDWGSCIISITRAVSKKIGVFIPSICFMRLLCISINLTYNLAWNTVVMPGQVFLTATWKFQVSYKNRYTELSVLHLLPLLNP